MSDHKVKVVKEGTGGFVYFLGVIAAAVYFIQRADGFGEGLLGLLQAFVWPAFLIYNAFKALGV